MAACTPDHYLQYGGINPEYGGTQQDLPDKKEGRRLQYARLRVKGKDVARVGFLLQKSIANSESLAFIIINRLFRLDSR